MTRLRSLTEIEAWADAHVVALTAECDDATAEQELALGDAVALLHLDDETRAMAILATVARGDDAAARRARVIAAWADLRGSAHTAFHSDMAGLPPETQARLRALEALDDPERFAGAARALPATLAAEASSAAAQYYDARGLTPWLAGTLSVVLPGAGQAYAGSWQGAAVSFLLNAVLIGSTLELARHHLYVTATAAGTAASIFYVGNVLNAVDLAERVNDVASSPARDRVERLLAPELATP